MISVVTSTRNDAYDGDSLHRNQVFVSSLVWLAEQHNLDMELIHTHDIVAGSYLQNEAHCIPQRREVFIYAHKLVRC